MKLLIKGFNTLGFAIPLISELFIFIDHIIYWIANLSLQLFFKLEEISANMAVNAPKIEAIMDRIMVLAGVFALFRVAIMLIEYLIHPEKTKELSKSSTSIITSVIIAIVLLVSSKFIFRELGQFQNLIFTNQLIPNLVYGPQESNSNDSRSDVLKNQSGRFVNNIWLIFYTPKNENGCVGTNTGSCLAYNRVKSGEYGTILALAGTQYTDFDYLPVVSGIVGIVLIYYFLRFSIDLGIRIVELFTLQVLSPIPIIMSIDPSRKNQLKTFATTYLGVYAQVFIRVLTFYMAFVVIDLLEAMPDSINGTSSAMLLKTDIGLITNIVLIIAVFQAASKLPGLIEKALGVKLGIDTSAKGFGGVLKGILGGTTGLIAGGIAGGAGGALAGAASGMWNAGMGAAASKNAAAGVSAAVAAVGKSHQLGGRIANSNGLLSFTRSGAENFFGANKRDAAELARFDRLSGDQDKLIEGYNKDMNVRTTAEQLRSGIDTALDTSFAGSAPNRKNLETFLNSNTEYSQMQSEFQEMFGAGGQLQHDSAARQDAINRINEKRASLETEYKDQRQRFGELQFSKYQRNIQNANTPGFVPEAIDENFKKALEDYNAYVTSHDMADRTITSYTRSQGAGSLEEARDINDRDKINIQAQIDASNQEKERISNEKKTFQEDPRVKARANRDKPKDADPWTRS